MAAVVLLVLIVLVLVKCCCRRQPTYVRQRVPLDQSVKTSPPSYRYHDNPYHENNFRPALCDKFRVRQVILTELRSVIVLLT